MEQPILQVEHLTKFFSVGPHAEVHAVDDVNFTLRRGRTFGLVGEFWLWQKQLRTHHHPHL